MNKYGGVPPDTVRSTAPLLPEKQEIFEVIIVEDDKAALGSDIVSVKLSEQPLASVIVSV